MAGGFAEASDGPSGFSDRPSTFCYSWDCAVRAIKSDFAEAESGRLKPDSSRFAILFRAPNPYQRLAARAAVGSNASSDLSAAGYLHSLLVRSCAAAVG